LKILVDAHTHSISSGHAYSTIYENTLEAQKKGLEAIVVSDHGPAVPGAPNLVYFWNQRVFPEFMNDVRVIKGVEANILDYSGKLDVPDEYLARLEFVNAGLHDIILKPGTVEENTNAFVEVLKNPYVDAIVHPGNPKFPVDIDKVVRTAAQYNKLIEINNGSFSIRKGSEVNCLEFIKACKKYSVRISCGTDAHICCDVGRFDTIYRLIEEGGLPEELVVCRSRKSIQEYIDERKVNKKPLGEIKFGK